MRFTGFPDQIDIHPRDYQEIGFKRDFTQIDSTIALDTDSIVLTGEARDRVYNWVYNEYGRHENIEAYIYSNLGKKYNYFLDLKNLRFADSECEVGIMPRKGTPHFIERAKGTSFELLRSLGHITDSMLIDVPYLIQQEHIGVQALILTIATIQLTQQLITVVFEISKFLGDGLDIVGTGLLTTIAKAVALAIWLALTVIALIQTLAQLKELLFPKIRYLKACSDYNLIQAGMSYLGYSLQSSVIEMARNIYTLPITEGQKNKGIINFLQNEQTGSFNKGYPRASDTTPNLMDLIDYYLAFYNQRLFAYEGLITIESKAFFASNPLVSFKKTFANEEKREKEWQYNQVEIWGRKYIHWTVDISDVYSPDNIDGLRAEYISRPINVLNEDLVDLTGLDEYQAPFSFMLRKDSLNRVEKIAKIFFSVCDNVVSAFGGSSNFENIVDSRIGVGVISSQYYAVTKKLYIKTSDGKQSSDYQQKLSADQIYIDYHQDLEVSAIESRIVEMRLPFTDNNWELIQQNNFIADETGLVCEVLDVNWKDSLNYGTFTLKIPDSSGFNVETVKLT